MTYIENPDLKLSEFVVFTSKALSAYANSFNEHKLKLIIDYYNETMFQHFDLYQYVFTNEANIATIEEELNVENIIETGNLNEAKKFHIWEYEEKLKVVTSKENDLDKFYLNERIRLNQEEDLFKKDADKNVGVNEDVDLNEEVRCCNQFRLFSLFY